MYTSDYPISGAFVSFQAKTRQDAEEQWKHFCEALHERQHLATTVGSRSQVFQLFLADQEPEVDEIK